MATITGTHVNFVKVPTMAKFDDLTTKADGTIYFIVDEKKIYLDGVMYGFNSNDISDQFLELTGGNMSGDIYMANNKINHLKELHFNDISYIRTHDAEGGFQFHVGTEGRVVLSLRADNENIIFDTESIIGIPEPVENSSPISKGYLETNVINKKGVNNGFAGLDNTGKVPTAQLPSYVDDVVEYAKRADFPAAGESGKLYLAIDTERIWRWTGSTYAEISPGSGALVLGITSSTAYRGDNGLIAYNHTLLTDTNDNPHAITKANVGLGSVQNYGIASETQARTGEVSNVYMTPLRTKEAIIEIAPKLSWEVVS